MWRVYPWIAQMLGELMSLLVEIAIALLGGTDTRCRRAEHDGHPCTAVALPRRTDRVEEFVLVQCQPRQSVISTVPPLQARWKWFVFNAPDPANISINGLRSKIIVRQPTGAGTNCIQGCTVAATGS